MNHTTTPSAFTHTGRKLALALALGVGMVGVGGCGKKPSAALTSKSSEIELLSCENIKFQSAEITAYTFGIENHPRVRFALSLVEQGNAREIAQWNVEPRGKAKFHLSLLESQGRIETANHVENACISSFASAFQIPDGMVERGHSWHSTGTLDPSKKNIFWNRQYFPKDHVPLTSSSLSGHQWAEQLELTRKQGDSQLLLTVEIPPEETSPPAPSPLQGSKTK